MRKKADLMKKGLGILALTAAWLFMPGEALAAEPVNEPLDKSDPVYFYGETIEYKGEKITLGEKDIYIDGSLSDAVCEKYDYVYNDFVEAYKDGAMKTGTLEKPMNVYLAPYVYWIDNPDDPEVREGVNGDKIPYGLWIDCGYLSLNGLTDDPENVVLAVNRGQNAGAIGNYTMFYINGTGTHTENLTMGNYCCVDLEYPLMPSLSREKRQDAITQSQLVLTNGSKITAENCNFISRLNSCPFVGGTKILFEDCHFECTDDSLPTSAVYVNCDFDFYSSKPFYNTTGTGSVMLGCTFNLMHGANQYLTKVGGIVTIIDATFNSTKKDQYIGWVADPAPSLRCYSGNITVNYTYEENGETKKETINNYEMDQNQPYVNVNITGQPAMDAYRVEYNNKVIYNVYNLVKGSDDWDPMEQKDILKSASEASGRDYTNIPTILKCSASTLTLVNGGSQKITTSARGFVTTDGAVGKITWSVEDSLKDYITLKDNGDGSCKLTCKNEGLTVVKGMVYAKDESGLWAGVYVTAEPETQPAPKFVKKPVMSLPSEGRIQIDYTLPNAELLTDYSSIEWYRCSDAKGEGKVMVAVSKENEPLKNYTLSYGDVGYYIMAVITPKQLCTFAGEEVVVISTRTITLDDVTASPFTLSTDFSNFAYDRQAQIIPGFWSRDVYKAWLTEGEKLSEFGSGWIYGFGEVGYGSEGLYGLLPSDRGARLMYTPPAGTYGDMELTLVVNPEKNAGQGFGSAKQYMDIFIKFDTTTLTGYALRLERISTLACGVQAALVQYDNDTVTYISDKVTTSAFNAECTISLSIKDGVLSTKITTTHEQSDKQIEAGLLHSVELTANITDNTYGGMGILFTGTVPVGNRVMFNSLDVNWNESEAVLEEPVPVELGEKEEEPEKTKLKKGKVITVANLKYKVTNNATNGKGTLMLVGMKKKTAASVKIVNTVTYKGVTYKVTGIGKNAFAKCSKVKKITIAATGLKTVQKNALKGIHKKCVIKVPKKQFKSYQKLLKNKGQESTVTITK